MVAGAPDFAQSLPRGGFWRLPPDQKDQFCEWLYEHDALPLVPTHKQAVVLCRKSRSMREPVFWGGGMSGGKGLTNETRVSTPFGWKPIGTLREGDQVHNALGGVSRVLRVYHRGVQPCYRFTFSDGASIVCDEDHLWFGWEAMKEYKSNAFTLNGKRQVGRVYTVPEIVAMMARKKGKKPGTGGSFLIPVAEPLRYSMPGRTDLPWLDPYALGAFLGDAHLRSDGSVYLSSRDPEIVQRVTASVGVEPREHLSDRCPTYIYRDPALAALLARDHLPGKLSFEKFIPPHYLRADISDRVALLQGLMDTDGTASRDGKIYFSTTSPRLAEDVRELVEGLGGTATVTVKTPTYRLRDVLKEGREAYTLYIKLPDPAMAFSLPRKRDRARKQNGLYRRLVSVTRTLDQETTCIAIDHLTGLFVAEHGIVTHNTALLCMVAIRESRALQNNRILMCRKTRSSFTLSTLEELQSQMLGCPDFTHRKGSSRFINTETGSEIWYTGVGDPDERQKLGSTQFGCILIDEAPEIDRPVFNMLQTRLRHPVAAKNNRLILMLTGNPWPGWVKEDFVTNPKPGYEFVQALAADNPHIYEKYSEDMRASLPESEYRAFILGDWDSFRPSGAVIPAPLLTAAQARYAAQAETANDADIVWGLDVARRGDDWTVMAERRGYVFELLDKWQGETLDVTTRRVLQAWQASPAKPRRINVDATAMGAGPYDELARMAAEGLFGETTIGEVVAAARADDHLHYVNMRAQLFTRLRQILDAGRGAIYPSEVVHDDLSAPERVFSAGRLGVTSKEVLRSTLGRSPDEGDALLLTLYEGHSDYVPEEDDLAGLTPQERERARQIEAQQSGMRAMITRFFGRAGLTEDNYDALAEEEPNDVGY